MSSASISRQQLLPAYRIHRSWPLNMPEADQPLFAHELERNFGPVVLVKARGAAIRPDGVCTRGLGYVEESFQNAFQRRGYNWKTILRMWLKDKAVRTRQPVLLAHDYYSGNFFHWLTDALPRLLLARQAGCMAPLVLPQALLAQPYLLPSLSWFGLQQQDIITIQPGTYLRSPEVTLVTPVAVTGNYHPQVLQQLRATARAAWQLPTTLVPGKRVYISRRLATRRRMLNEDELFPILQRYGFEIVDAEKTSLEQMARLLAGADMLLSLHGAGLANMLFLPDGAQLVELRHQDDSGNNAYFAMAHALELPYCYLHVQPDSNRHYQQVSYTLDTAVLDALLRQRLG